MLQPSEENHCQARARARLPQVCSAVKHMHERRMMHRDLKPSNIFITVDGRLKLGDLGLSRYFSSKTLQAVSVVGTPYYMSPEVRELASGAGVWWQGRIRGVPPFLCFPVMMSSFA